MTSLSDGDVRQSDVLRWAQEQAQFLSPPSTHHVLLYLCMNAFYTDKNREDRKPGNVLTGRTRLRTIKANTGLSEDTIRRALNLLQDLGYVTSSRVGGDEQNEIFVAWTSLMDDWRAEVREGKRGLPEVFQPTARTRPRKGQNGNVVSLRSVSGPPAN